MLPPPPPPPPAPRPPPLLPGDAAAHHGGRAGSTRPQPRHTDKSRRKTGGPFCNPREARRQAQATAEDVAFILAGAAVRPRAAIAVEHLDFGAAAQARDH